MRIQPMGVALALIGLTGCTSPLDLTTGVPPRPLASEHRTFQPSTDQPEEPLPIAPPASAVPSTLTLPDALRLAMMHSPRLAAASWELRTADAVVLQAGLWPNPEFEAEVENFGGSGETEGFEAAEWTLSIGQVFPLGGDLGLARRVAALERSLAGWDYEALRIEVAAGTAEAFIDVLASQRRLALAQESDALAQQVLEVVRARADAGAVSPVEVTKAEVERGQAALAVERARYDLVASRQRLASQWGGDKPAFIEVAGAFETVPEVPPIEVLRERLNANPDLARWGTELALRRELIELARAQGIPDLSLSGGVRLIEETDDTAFVASIGVPIPVFDRNQGGILEARLRAAQAHALRESARIERLTGLVEAYQALVRSDAEVRTLRDRLLPGAESSYAAAEEAFRQGKIGALDLFDAERTLFEAKAEYVESLAGLHRAVVEVERLIAAPITAATIVESESGNPAELQP